MKTGLTILLVVLLILAFVPAGIAVELPTLPVLPTPAPTAAPTPWTGDSVPMTCIACAPPPCDCWPEC